MKKILSKLSSRKLWVTIGAIVGCILNALCGEPENSTQIISIIGLVVAAVNYVANEAAVDRAAVIAQNDTDDSKAE